MDENETKKIHIREVVIQQTESTVREGNYSASHPFDFKQLPQEVQQGVTQQTSASVSQQSATSTSPSAAPSTPISADPSDNP